MKNVLFVGLVLACFVMVSNAVGESQCDTIDVQERTKLFKAKLSAINETNDIVSTKTLQKQLDKKKCDISLKPAVKKTMSPSQLYEQRRDAVAFVGSLHKCGKCNKWHSSGATGYFIREDGILVTNYHVIENDKDEHMFGVMTYDGDVFTIQEVLAADKAGDVAVVKVNGKGFSVLGLAEEAKVGEPVWVLGHPSGHHYMLTDGMVSGYFNKKKDGANVSQMTITADFGLGSSGAPLLDANGNVIGMVSSTTPALINMKGVSKATKTKKKENHLISYAQMVHKNCVPVETIRALFK